MRDDQSPPLSQEVSHNVSASESCDSQPVAENGAPKEKKSRCLSRLQKCDNPSRWWWIFFPGVAVYHELLLRIFDTVGVFATSALLPVLLFSLAAGLILRLLVAAVPGVVGKRIFSGVVCGLWTVLLCVEYCCKSYFKTYFGVNYIFNMTGQVVGDFAVTMFEVILARIPFILLSLLPFVALMIFGRQIVSPRHSTAAAVWISLILAILFQAGGSLWGFFGSDSNVYRADYTSDAAVPRFGLVGTVRLEAQYAITGIPQAELEELDLDLYDKDAVDHPQAVTYASNAMDIDFLSLMAEADNSTVRAMHQYFNSRSASQQNEYTGLFKGKNLILLTAEAFSPYVISEELTPTLYKMTHSGFVFNNYYQPGWGQSTTGGEFAVMTGIIPTWINNNLSFYMSSKISMPFALGNQFSALGYNTVAYHNNSYTYYDRHLTHPNLGYDYKGVGNGLQMTGGGAWPYSDLEMAQLTADAYIDDYVNNGTPFHAYYMTVSGHANWGWGNAMSAKHREEAVAAYPDASQPVQGYIAANLEVEYMLSYLVEKLEAAGILDDTVFCLSADHYPYALVTDEADYYNELRGFEDTEYDMSRYKNTLILWCSDLTETVEVDTPCCSIDIIPTLSNLFDLEYDSRLLSGHDIFADNYTVNRVSGNMPLVILPSPDGTTKSWISAAGSYNANKKIFTPNDGITVSDGYVTTINMLIGLKYNYARALIQYGYYDIVFNGAEPALQPAAPPVAESTATELVDEPQAPE